MPTSTGLRRKMRRIGTLAFTLTGAPHTLTAYVDASERDMRRPAELRTYADRGHSAPFDSGWREIADDTLAWLETNGLTS